MITKKQDLELRENINRERLLYYRRKELKRIGLERSILASGGVYIKLRPLRLRKNRRGTMTSRTSNLICKKSYPTNKLVDTVIKKISDWVYVYTIIGKNIFVGYEITGKKGFIINIIK